MVGAILSAFGQSACMDAQTSRSLFTHNCKAYEGMCHQQAQEQLTNPPTASEEPFGMDSQLREAIVGSLWDH